MKVLAVDYGLKRVGLASGDFDARIAFPKGVIFRKNDENVLSELVRICRDEGYGKVVFGMPFNMDGTKSKQYEITQKFVADFRERLALEGIGDVSVEIIDERLSSFEADGYLEDFDGLKNVEKGERDMMAAKVILERWFTGQSS